jgi:hypothetical protein
MNNITAIATSAIIKTIDLNNPTLGIQVVAATFRLGATATEFSHLAQTLPGGVVYNGLPEQMDAILDEENNTVIYRIVLDENVGDFSYGNVGLYLPSGELLTYTPLPEVRSKTRSDLPNAYGDYHAYRIPISIAPFSSTTPTIPPQVIYDPDIFRGRTYTVETAPSAIVAGEGASIYVKDATDGKRPYWSDGQNWRDAASNLLA